MKKIEFGFANDVDPKGSWQGIGIKEGLLLHDAIYYGSFSYRGNNYIVAKVDKDEYGRFSNLLNKFIVRDALVDVYADGSNTLFLNQEVSQMAQTFEANLNRENVIDRIKDINDIIDLCCVHQPSKLFKLVESDDRIVATSITDTAFTNKNEAIKNCRRSLSDMQIMLDSNNRTR